MRGWLLLASALAACASPKNPALDPLLSVTDSATTLIVEAKAHPEIQPDPGYRVTFASRSMPSELIFREQNVLGRVGNCPSEEHVGFAVFPAVIASDTTLSTTNGPLATTMSGPAVAQTTYTFDLPYVCAGDGAGGGNHMTGTTTLTFFPFGRIARRDAITFNTAVLPGNAFGPAPGPCNCGGGIIYVVTSYWTFQVADAIQNSDDTVLPPANNGLTGDGGCAHYADGQQIGTLSLGEGAIGRRAATPQNSTATAFTFDVARTVAEADVVQPLTRQIDSHVQLVPPAAGGDFAACSDVLSASRDHKLTAGGEIASFEHGMYVFLEDHGASVEVRATELVPGGFVISLPHIDEHLRVTRAATDGQYYIPQLDFANDRTLVWVRDALDAGETMTIDRAP